MSEEKKTEHASDPSAIGKTISAIGGGLVALGIGVLVLLYSMGIGFDQFLGMIERHSLIWKSIIISGMVVTFVVIVSQDNANKRRIALLEAKAKRGTVTHKVS